VLAAAGLRDGLNATGHWAAIKELELASEGRIEESAAMPGRWMIA
jgi:hypothetical protein